jgi:hypothetical protein
MRGVRELSSVSAWACALGVSVAMAVAHAQDPPAPRVLFDHDGQGVTGFALYAQPEKGKAIRIDLGLVLADRNGGRSVTVPALPDGTYTLSVAAYNRAGESARVGAAPARITVRQKQAAVINAPGQRAPDPLPLPPAEVSASAPPPSPSPVSSKPKKPLGRLWRAVVGDD